MDQEFDIDKFIYNSSWVRLGIILFVFLIIFLPHPEKINITGVCILIIFSASLYFIYRILPSTIRHHQTFPYMIYTLDVLALTLLIDLIGGIASNFHLLYFVPLIVAAVYFQFTGWLYGIVLVTTSYLVNILAHIEEVEKIGYHNLLTTTLPLFWGVTGFVAFLSSQVKRYKREIEIKSNLLIRTKAKRDALVELYENTMKMFSLTDIDKLLEYVVNKALHIINMERGIVMFLNEEEDILVGFYSNKLSSVRVKDICIKKEEELFILVVKKKEVIIVPDTELEEEHPARRLTAKYKSRSLVIIPLVMNEERVMGIIWFDNQERLWEYNHTAVEETRDFLSHAAVVAIDAAYSRRLLKTLRESKGKLEKELKSTTDKFAALEKFTQYLTRSTEIDEMAKIFDEVANMLDLKSYRLMLVDASNNFLFTLAWRGFLSEEIRIKIGEGIVGKVVLTGKPTLSIEDGNITNYELYETPLCIPLKKHDKVIGVIEIRSLKENTSIDPIKYYVLLSLANLLTVGLSRRVTSPISSAPSPTIILDKE